MKRDPSYVLPLPARKPIDLADRKIARADPLRPCIVGELSLKVSEFGRSEGEMMT